MEGWYSEQSRIYFQDENSLSTPPPSFGYYRKCFWQTSQMIVVSKCFRSAYQYPNRSPSGFRHQLLSLFRKRFQSESHPSGYLQPVQVDSLEIQTQLQVSTHSIKHIHYAKTHLEIVINMLCNPFNSILYCFY